MPDDQDPTVSSPSTPRPRSLAFTGKRAPFLRLLLVNGLLSVITVGIYRFWARTRIRRYVWLNLRLLDDPLEYTGTGGELFLGFLIVIAVLFPMGMVYSTIAFVVPPDLPEMQIALEVLYYIVLFALLQIGFYRMWRYRMSRTVWRGVRFGLEGSAWSYLKLASGWTIVSAMTLGLAYPWMAIELWRYQIEHTRLGREAFVFLGSGKELFRPWLTVWIPGMAVVAASGYLGYLVRGSLRQTGRVNELTPEVVTPVAISGVIVAVGLILMAFTYLWFTVRRTRLQISGLRIADARFVSKLRYWRLFVFAFLAIFLTILLAGLAIGAILFGGGIPMAAPETGPVIGVVFGLLLAFLILPTVWMTVFSFEVIKQIAATTGCDRPEAIERAAQSTSPDPKTGEGLADAFDIGGGF